jgi:hypothetical protein
VLAEMGRPALDRAGLTRDDIDLVQIYDAFTINVLTGLEQLGFCGRGDCDDRQVPGAHNCLLQAGGLVMSAYMVKGLGTGT